MSLSNSGINEPSGSRLFVGQPVWLHGVLAVVIFSLTAPLTSIALDAFTPAFIAFMRALVAGLGSLGLALYFKWSIPKGKDLFWLLLCSSSVALVFPYTLAEALLVWHAKDMGVVLAGLPLVTALIAVVIFNEKTTAKFWLSLLAGTWMLILFAYSQSNGVLHYSLFIMLLSAGLGYAVGGHVAKRLGGFQTICWMMILNLPISLFGVGYTAIDNSPYFNGVYLASILALVYLSIMSQWIGFHFWYGSMVKMGIAQTGQLQLLQPFFTLLMTYPLLGAQLSLLHWVFAGLVTLTVWFVRRSS